LSERDKQTLAPLFKVEQKGLSPVAPLMLVVDCIPELATAMMRAMDEYSDDYN